MEERVVEAEGAEDDDLNRMAVRVEKAAWFLDISKSKAHQLIREKKLHAVKVGDTLRVPVAAIRQLLGIN